MSKQEELVPELRFPGNKNIGEWEVIPLLELADKNVRWSFTGGPFGSNLKASSFTKSGYRVVQLQNIGDGEFNDEYKVYTSQEKADELLSCNIYSGDIILSKMGDPVGRACIMPGIDERFVMGSDGIRLVVDENRFSKYFIFSAINYKVVRSAIEKRATGSTRKRIGLQDLKQIPVPVPKELREQQKIAACLSSLDALLKAERAKLAALQDHKKGLMQQLFPAEGEKLPKLRFPEFVGSGEWESKTLADIVDFSKGKGISKSDISSNGKLKCIRYGELYTDYGEVIDEVVSSTNVPDSELVLSRANDVIIPASGETKEDIAIASCVLHDGIALGADLNILRTEVNGIFMSYYLRSARKKAMASMSQGVSVIHLYSSQLKTLQVDIPTPAEQEKIAFCLSSVDKRIQLQQRLLEPLEVHKKGLMQGLFPQPKHSAL